MLHFASNAMRNAALCFQRDAECCNWVLHNPGDVAGIRSCPVKMSPKDTDHTSEDSDDDVTRIRWDESAFARGQAFHKCFFPQTAS